MAIVHAFLQGGLESVQRVIDSTNVNFSLDTNNVRKATALHLAILQRRTDVVDWLLSIGADPTIRAAGLSAPGVDSYSMVTAYELAELHFKEYDLLSEAMERRNLVREPLSVASDAERRSHRARQPFGEFSAPAHVVMSGKDKSYKKSIIQTTKS